MLGTMRFRVTLDTQIEPTPSTPEDEQAVLAILESVIQHLDEDEALDPDAGGSLSSGSIQISVIVEASTPEDAFHKGTKQIQLAVERSGATVDDWSHERFIVEPEEEPGRLLLAGTG